MSTPMLLEKILADVAFWIGLVSVLLFAYSRFNISLPDTDELSPPLEPRSFTTAFRFQLAACTYVGLYAGVYLLLTFAGAFPWIQEVVKQLFGSLDDAGESVGTPAWAALVATSILPSTPGFRWIDERWRVLLHEFASIPSKARMLGREILNGLPRPAPERPDENADLASITDAIDRHKERYTRLRRLAEALSQVDSGRVSRRYRTFVAQHQGVVDKIEREFSVEAQDCNTLESARYVEARFRLALKRAARFVACAMLNAEPSEYSIRSRLKDMGLEVRVVGFDFRPVHLVLALTTIAVMTLVGCYASVLLYAYARQIDVVPLIAEHSPRFFSWVFITVLTYTLPLILAAGVGMYLLDRASAGEAIEGADRSAIAILTFAGAAGLAFFSLLAYSFVMLMVASPEGAAGVRAIPIWRLLPWSIPPATVATVFLLMAAREPRQSRGAELALDAVAHGGAAAVVSLLATLLAMLASGGQSNLPSGLIYYLAPITAGAIGASIGAVLCTTCRRRLVGTYSLAVPMQPASAVMARP